jgi:hypothetical protein
MARHYRWALRRRFTAQYLLVLQRSVGVFCFLSLKLRVISIRVHGASSNAQEIFWSLFYQAEKSLLGLFKNLIK